MGALQSDNESGFALHIFSIDIRSFRQQVAADLYVALLGREEQRRSIADRSVNSRSLLDQPSNFSRILFPESELKVLLPVLPAKLGAHNSQIHRSRNQA